jgi:hypothetical protein
MDRLARLVEELEARPQDAARVASLRRWMIDVGPRAVAAVAPWLVAGAGVRRPARVPAARLREAAGAHAVCAGLPRWEFDAGVDAAEELAEGLALMLPAARETAPGPSAADWLDDWTAALGEAGAAASMSAMSTTAATSAALTIAHVARLPDALARRHALRLAAGLARPVATPWQWTRALAAATGADPQALAWRAFVEGTVVVATAAPPAGTAPVPESTDREAPWPRPAPWPAYDDLVAPIAARAPALQAAIEAGRAHAEARWPGWRVQLVRAPGVGAGAGGTLAAWHVDGELLNARLPIEARGLLAQLDRLLAPTPRPASSRAIDAVLLGWDRVRGRAVTRDALERAGALVAAPRARRARAGAGEPGGGDDISWHLALTGLLPEDPRRAVLPSWPPADAAPHDAAPTPPALFVAATAPVSAHDLPALLHDRARGTRLGATGHVLRVVPGPAAGAGGGAAAATAAPAGWIARPPTLTLLALLQYLPADWWRTGASPDPRALAAGEAGVALWSTGADGEPALLPLARVALAGLPAATLLALHAAARERPATRFGTVVQLAPWTVVEIAFDAGVASRRHRIGAVLSGARLVAWRGELDVSLAHGVDALRRLLA